MPVDAEVNLPLPGGSGARKRRPKRHGGLGGHILVSGELLSFPITIQDAALIHKYLHKCKRRRPALSKLTNKLLREHV